MKLKEKLSLFGASPKPRDLPHFGQRHDKRRAALNVLPHVSVTNYGARVASQQEPYPPSWQKKNSTKFINNNTEKLHKNEIALNMDTFFMVKPDKSFVTKTGHFYLFVTAILKIVKNYAIIILTLTLRKK